MTYNLVVTLKAKEEITEGYIYYETLKPGLGEKFLEHLDFYFTRITTSPEQFPQKRAPYRQAFIKNFLSWSFFEIRNNSIIVYSVFNTWQNPKKKPGGWSKLLPLIANPRQRQKLKKRWGVVRAEVWNYLCLNE